MLQYAQDAAETETPWRQWQFRSNDKSDWVDAIGALPFNGDYDYRRKPRVIIINGIEVPEPMREKPENGTRYFYPCIPNGFCGEVGERRWDDDSDDQNMLSSGVIHLTREAAGLHAKALLSFTKKEAK